MTHLLDGQDLNGKRESLPFESSAGEQVSHAVICHPATRSDDAESNRPFCGATELRQLTVDREQVNARSPRA